MASSAITFGTLLAFFGHDFTFGELWVKCISWAVIREKTWGSVNCTFYAFALDATIIAFSNVSTRLPNIKILPRQITRKNYRGITAKELYRRMVEEVRNFALSYLESFSMLILPLDSSKEFICSLDQMKLREQMAELCFKPEDIPQIGLSESEQILLAKLMLQDTVIIITTAL